MWFSACFGRTVTDDFGTSKNCYDVSWYATALQHQWRFIQSLTKTTGRNKILLEVLPYKICVCQKNQDSWSYLNTENKTETELFDHLAYSSTYKQY